MAAAAQQPVSAQVVGNAFVQQYYHILHHSPALVHKFYQNPSKLGRPEEDGSMSITTTMDAINEKILSLNYGELKAEIKSVDAQESFNAGVTVLVTGYLTEKDNSIRNFTQSFFLAPQEKGYYVLNDMFRYIENANLDAANEVLVNEVVHVDAPVTPEEAEPSPLQESVISEQTTVLAEEVNGEDADKPSDNGDILIVEEEVPVAEVVEEVQDKVQMVVESDTKVEEAPKKSYASIVMDMKESGVVFSSPAPPMRKSPPKSQVQQVNPTLPAASGGEVLVSGSDAVENGNNQEGEGDGYSIYIKGLPLNATPAQLEDEFKKFGPIKSGGIQVRSNRQQGVCFGFVKYEVESAVQKAMEASPITIGGRQAVIEEKRSTNSRVNRGRFAGGRGPGGFRNDGMRGRGNYGGGGGRGGYGSRGDFGGRAEFGNRGNNRGGGMSGGRGGGSDGGYQRSDSMGSNSVRYNRSGMMAVNGTTKNMPPRVPATA
ncbi:hypothetical protein LguiA_011745 [Lonicera macranthoides]